MFLIAWGEGEWWWCGEGEFDTISHQRVFQLNAILLFHFTSCFFVFLTSLCRSWSFFFRRGRREGGGDFDNISTHPVIHIHSFRLYMDSRSGLMHPTPFPHLRPLQQSKLDSPQWSVNSTPHQMLIEEIPSTVSYIHSLSFFLYHPQTQQPLKSSDRVLCVVIRCFHCTPDTKTEIRFPGVWRPQKCSPPLDINAKHWWDIFTLRDPTLPNQQERFRNPPS